MLCQAVLSSPAIGVVSDKPCFARQLKHARATSLSSGFTPRNRPYTCTQWTQAKELYYQDDMRKYAPASRSVTRNSLASSDMRPPTVDVPPDRSAARVSIVAVVPSGKPCKLGPRGGFFGEGPQLIEVFQHVAQRLHWIDDRLHMQVFSEDSLHDPGTLIPFPPAASTCDLLMLVGCQRQETAELIKAVAPAVPNYFVLGSSASIHEASPPRLDGMDLAGAFHKLAAALPFTANAKAEKLLKEVGEYHERLVSVDDLIYLSLLPVNAYVTKIPLVSNLKRDMGLDNMKCMGTNCGEAIVACMKDPECRQALQCLGACRTTDQVAQYRCIVSYESELLEAFTLCIMHKHNCLGLCADLPLTPDVQPMREWRGKPLTHALAEEIFIGHLDTLPWSWRVVCGQNPAYDAFPCQYQLYYPIKAKGSMWYDPVFKVRTLDGREVWRRRHYKVRRGSMPGTFHLSVLDNGVTSKEFWRIVDCPDDLSWALFYYAGTASEAGLAYTGSVFVTPDGQWPAREHDARISAALESAGIKRWELSLVDNCKELCEGADLTVPENWQAFKRTGDD